MSRSYRKDLTGQRFGKLKVTSFVPTEDNHSHWECECDCGKRVVVAGYSLTLNNTTSCGCLQRKISSEKARRLINNNKVHELSNTRIYQIWADIKQRCFNTNNQRYNDYGGRGITVCEEWRNDFKSFYDWAMKNGYNETLSIDRIDVNGNYEPSNCRWVDIKTQNRNKRNNIIVEYQGQQMILVDAAEKLGIKYSIVKSRFQRGERGEQLFRPEKNQK